MTLGEIKNLVMFQTNNDSEDIDDYLPALTDYINEAYDRLVTAWANQHVPSTDYPALEEEPNDYTGDPWTLDVPKTPEWTHKHLADWATWLIYKNGNPQKQQRGYAFRESFERFLTRVIAEGGINGVDENGNRIIANKFINIPG